MSPKDPYDLSLEPSKTAGVGTSDFSKVRGHAATTPRGNDSHGQRGADFSNVSSHADTVPGQRGGHGGGGGGSTYTVRKGDTLSAISQRHYGKASLWRRIFDANRDQIDNPDLIHPGQELRLPPLDD